MSLNGSSKEVHSYGGMFIEISLHTLTCCKPSIEVMARCRHKYEVKETMYNINLVNSLWFAGAIGLLCCGIGP